MTHSKKLQTLTDISIQISPLLTAISQTSPIIAPHQNNHKQLNALYRYWKEHYPEAGQIYWLTRTWTMLIWQPITIALITTYYSDSVPKISRMRQGLNLDNGIVGHFDFASDKWQVGDQHQRLLLAATELKSLLTLLADQFDDVSRMSPSTREKLLADTIMEMLLRGLKHMVNRQLLANKHLQPTFALELQHWQQALDLPITRFGRLDVTQEGDYVIQRRACCMHYRRKDGTYCQGCPQKK